jgi:carboxylesterase
VSATTELFPNPLDHMPGRRPSDVVIPSRSRVLVYLIHGVTGTPAEMRYLTVGLSRQGWNVYAPTLPGHGLALRDLVATRVDDWRSHVRSQLEYARAHYDLVFAAGLSAGGLLALDAAESLPLDGLGILSPTFFYDGWNRPWTSALLPFGMKVVPYCLQHLFFHVDGPPYGIKDKFLQDEMRAAYNVRAMLREWISLWWPRGWRSGDDSGENASKGNPLIPVRIFTEVDRLIARVSGSMGKIEAPTLILQAREDDVSSPRNAQFLHDGLGSRQKEIVYLDDCYHVITVDKKKREVVTHLGEFFRRCCPATSVLAVKG